MSKLEKLPEKNFKFILKRMYDDIDRFGRNGDLISGANKKIVKDIFDDIGISIDQYDLGFILALYKLNPNFATEKIKIPELHTYEVITKRYANVSIREYWKNEVDSYFEDEDDVNDFISWFGGSDWWEGEMIDREDYDEETTDTDIDEINKLT
jgi:hypothetical protein